MSNDFDNTYPLAGSNNPGRGATHSYEIPQRPQIVNITCPPPRSSFPVFGCVFSLFLFGAVVCGLFFLLALIGIASKGIAGNDGSPGLIEQFDSGDAGAAQKVLLLEIDGVIMGGRDSFVAKQIRQAQKDTNIKAIVLRVDSPGGSISGSDYFLYLLKKLKAELNVPVVVSMGGLAASGGYYVSMVGDEIFAEQSTMTGSIGVIVPLYNGSRFLRMLGFESTPITSGPLKTMGSFSKTMTDEERAVFQSLVDDGFAQFKKVIYEGRSAHFDEQTPEKLDAIATGQIFSARQALDNNLIDKIGYVDDAIESAMNRAGLAFNPGNPKNGCQIIRYKKQPTLADALIGTDAEAKSPNRSVDSEVGEILSDLTTPRAYYLCPGVLPLDRE